MRWKSRQRRTPIDIESSPDKVRRLRELLPAGTPIEVDGGIDANTAGLCVKAGATLLVAGTSVFRADDPADAYRTLVAAAGAV